MEPDASNNVSNRVRTVTANGVAFAYLEAGTGPLALCLHGFPDSAHTWRHLLPVLADAGYRAVAPWMRAYAPTAVPADGAYQTGALATDAVALHEALGGDGDAVIIGHDWGAMATYGAAVLAPERFRSVVAMSVPPAPVVAGGMTGTEQLKRSWYIWFFQLAGLPEVIVPTGDFSFISELWEDWSPGYDATHDVAAVRAALASDANLAGALGYYRALFDPAAHHEAYANAQAATQGIPTQPTLYLHGTNDGCMGAELVNPATGAVLTVPGSRVELVANTGHFLHLEDPDTVNDLIVGFVNDTRH
jgi:pimeloyl-ACP methyl ester carboxylesterase